MTETATAAPAAEPNGIGGWLIFPMLGTLFSPVLNAFGLYQNIDALLKHSHQMPALWTYFVSGEAICTLAILVGWIIAAFMLFQHRRPFPRLFVLLLAATLILNVIDTVGAVALFGQSVDASAIRDIGRPIVALAIWGPYMYVSQRVKNTFVH